VRSGDEVDARIIDVDARRRRLSLSLRPKREEREERPRREERPKREPEQRGTSSSDRRTSSGEGSGLRTGAFDALADLDLEER
jgi:small subunit ribosomal protein S1